MKEFKATIVNKMIEKSQDMRIVSLRETAAELGINHISAQDTRDIAQRLRKVEGYHLVQMMNTPNDSLFCSLCLVENGVEFDDGKDVEFDARLNQPGKRPRAASTVGTISVRPTTPLLFSSGRMAAMVSHGTLSKALLKHRGCPWGSTSRRSSKEISKRTERSRIEPAAFCAISSLSYS